MNVATRELAAQQVALPAAQGSVVTNVACRAVDLALAGVLVVLLIPLFLLVAVAIRLESKGAPVFRQRRIGRDGKAFTVCKFRTMYSGSSNRAHRDYVTRLIRDDDVAANGAGPLYKLQDDDRVTRVGRLLRRTSLDELPQLWNVLRGQMSLVGPRPVIPYEAEHYPPEWHERFAVRPGVTGLWQVSGRSRLTYEQMVDLDRDYVRRRSLWLNVVILARTPLAVARSEDAA